MPEQREADVRGIDAVIKEAERVYCDLDDARLEGVREYYGEPGIDGTRDWRYVRNPLADMAWREREASLRRAIVELCLADREQTLLRLLSVQPSLNGQARYRIGEELDAVRELRACE